MSVKGFEVLKDPCLESVGDCGVSSAQNPSEETNSLGLEQQICGALHRYHKSVGFFLTFVLMDPLFRVKVSPALVLSCVTFTVLFVPLAK